MVTRKKRGRKPTKRLTDFQVYLNEKRIVKEYLEQLRDLRKQKRRIK